MLLAPKKIQSWKLLWNLICYQPKLYTTDSLLWILIMGLPAIPGLIIREFFDSLTGKAQFGLTPLVWILLLLIILFVLLNFVRFTKLYFTLSFY